MERVAAISIIIKFVNFTFKVIAERGLTAILFIFEKILLRIIRLIEVERKIIEEATKNKNPIILSPIIIHIHERVMIVARTPARVMIVALTLMIVVLTLMIVVLTPMIVALTPMIIVLTPNRAITYPHVLASIMPKGTVEMVTFVDSHIFEMKTTIHRNNEIMILVIIVMIHQIMRMTNMKRFLILILLKTVFVDIFYREVVNEVIAVISFTPRPCLSKPGIAQVVHI